MFAIIPNIASWAGGLMTNTVGAAGSTPAEVGEEGFANAGPVHEGAILAGMALGAIIAFIIDKKFVPAATYCSIGATLGFVGLIHAESVGWNVGGQIALGCLSAGIILLVFAFTTRSTPEPAPTTPATDDAEVPAQRPAEASAAAMAPMDTATRPTTA